MTLPFIYFRVAYPTFTISQATSYSQTSQLSFQWLISHSLLRSGTPYHRTVRIHPSSRVMDNSAAVPLPAMVQYSIPAQLPYLGSTKIQVSHHIARYCYCCLHSYFEILLFFCLHKPSFSQLGLATLAHCPAVSLSPFLQPTALKLPWLVTWNLNCCAPVRVHYSLLARTYRPRQFSSILPSYILLNLNKLKVNAPLPPPLKSHHSQWYLPPK